MKPKYPKVLLCLIALTYALGCSEEEIVTYELSTVSVPAEGGSISPEEGEFNAGEEVELTATPSEGYEFVSWSGAITGDENPRTITIDSNKEITASFALLDMDGDGVPDNMDQCNDTPSGEAVNESGCSESQVDSDGDGVNNDVDECPQTPEGETVDETGCSSSQTDSDQDGVSDNIDTCPDTPEGESVNDNGCSTSQTEGGASLDSDEDGVSDDVDQCPQTPVGETVDTTGCSSTQKDMDGDGVPNDKDRCNDTPEGESVDENGCSTSQVDSDGDGIYDDNDQCNDTPEGETVDEEGCAPSQIDSDNDGVNDDKDECPETPSGEKVDGLGCSESQKDGDGDGVPDNADNCPDTPKDEETDEKGCSASQVDTDGDGISDDADRCPDTPTGEAVDAEGCSDSQKDSDGDGVADDLDQCADTPEGDTVDEKGCTVVQLTYVPDDAFEQYLIDQGYDDVLDDYVITENIKEVEDVFIFEYSDIKDLTGLEDFERMKRLSLENTSIKSLDVSQYENLTFLTLMRNRFLNLLSIDNTDLETVNILNQSMELVNISNNQYLKKFHIEDSGVLKLIISNNPILAENSFLDFRDSAFGEFIFENNATVQFIDCFVCSFTKITVKNNGKLKSLILDPAYFKDRLTSLTISNNPNFGSPQFLENVGFDFENLLELNIQNSSFAEVDVSKNIVLEKLNVTGNPLTCIKVNQGQLDDIPDGWVKDAEDTYSLTCE